MKKSILWIFSILICSGVSFAQVQEFNIGAQNNSIVRTIKGDSVLFYTKDASNDSWFVLYDGGPNLAKAFKFDIGTDLRIFDIRIYDEKYAYYCGSIDNGGGTYRGLVGVFSIVDVFSGTDDVRYSVVWGNGTDFFYPVELRHLDLLDSAGHVCMAMVGEVDYTGLGIHITTVVSAYYDGSGWSSWALGHKGFIGVTDIACLDNMVVATGTVENDTGCFVKTFRPTLSFPRHAFSGSISYSLVYGKSAGKVLIAHDWNDTAVVAHFDTSTTKVSTVMQKVPFEPITGKPLLPMRAMKTTPPSDIPYGNSWEMLELTTVNGETFLLQRAAYPTASDPSLRDWRLRTMIPVSTTIDGWMPEMGVQQSMDITKGMKTSANYVDYLQLQGPNWQQVNNSCMLYSLINVVYGNVGIKLFDDTSFPLECDIWSGSFSPTVIEVDHYIKCRVD